MCQSSEISSHAWPETTATPTFATFAISDRSVEAHATEKHASLLRKRDCDDFSSVWELYVHTVLWRHINRVLDAHLMPLREVCTAGDMLAFCEAL
jgi:hypothetical protein